MKRDKLVGVSVSQSEYDRFEKFGNSEGLRVSTAIRNLALKELNYLEWEKKGKPRRKKGKKGKDPEEMDDWIKEEVK